MPTTSAAIPAQSGMKSVTPATSIASRHIHTTGMRTRPQLI